MAGEVAPFAAEADECSEVHAPTLAILRSSRLCELMVPSAYGGRFERVDSARGVRGAGGLHEGLGASGRPAGPAGHRELRPSPVGGSEAQRRAWLPRVGLGGESLAALALTEPEGGFGSQGDQDGPCDPPVPAAATSSCSRGASRSISNALSAELFTVLVREPAPEGAGRGRLTPWCWCPPDAPGGAGLADAGDHGRRTSSARWSSATWCCPPTTAWGPPGQRGSPHVFATLSVFRSSVAGAAVGLMEGGAGDRRPPMPAPSAHQFRSAAGAPWGRWRNLIADSWVDLESSRLLAYRAADAARLDPATHPRLLLAGQAGGDGGRPGAWWTAACRSWDAGGSSRVPASSSTTGRPGPCASTRGASEGAAPGDRQPPVPRHPRAGHARGMRGD